MKHLSKALALLLILTMLLPMGIAGVLAEEATDDIMTPYGKYPEPIYLTTGKRSDPTAQWPEGDNVDNNFFTRYTMDKINVQTKTIWSVDETAYVEKITLDMASDNLPDIFSISNDNYLLFLTLVENGMLADLTEAYEKCANWYLKDTAASFDFAHFEPYTIDGKLYGIPTGRYGYEHNMFWVRGDILDELGIKSEDIRTLEDIENLLVTFKEKYPDKIPLALNYQDPLTNYGVSFSADPIAMLNGAQPRQWVWDEDGSVVYGSTQPGMKEALKTLNDWYTRGLIDMEFATRSGTGVMDALTTSGEALSWFAPWWFGWNVSDLYTNVEGAYVVPINAPLNDAGEYHVPWGPEAGSVMLISAKCEHPEAAIKLLNIDFDMTRGFDEELTRQWDNARDENNPDRLVVKMNQLEPGGINIEYNNVVPTFGHGVKTYIETGDMSGLTCPMEVSETLMAAGYASGDPMYQDSYSRGVYLSRAIAAPMTDAENVIIHKPAFTQVTPSYSDLWPSLLTLERVAMLQFVMGERPVDEFDSFVEQWLAEGGQTLTDEINEMVGTAK